MVPFEEVLWEVKRVLQDACPDLLHSLFTHLLEAQVFSTAYYQSLFHRTDLGQAGLADVEDLARKLALPIWQKWDVSEGILSSMFSRQEDSGPDNNDPDDFEANDLLGLSETLFNAYLESIDLSSPGFDELLEFDSGFEEILDISGELDDIPTTACETTPPSPQQQHRKRRAGERPSRKLAHHKRSKTGPPDPESPPVTVPVHEGSFQINAPALPQVVHLHIATGLDSATLMPSGGGTALQIIQTINHLPPPVINNIVPVRPTYVLVSPQIVPLSPVGGAVAPHELSMSTYPASSLSDTVSRGQPSPQTPPASPSKDKMPSEISPSPPPLNKKRQSPVIPKHVEDYVQALKSHLQETCSAMQDALRMESHYIDTHLVQRKLVIRTGKNANKCLEKELVMLSDSERRKATVDRGAIFCDSGSKARRLITVFGKAGTGKSTLVQRLALDWSAGGLTQFRFVFLLNCKLLDLTRTSYSLKNLLFDLSSSPCCGDPEVVFKHVLSCPEKVLVVFDTFDDMKDLEGLLQNTATSATDNNYSVRQLFSGLFQKKILSGCTLLMATRPKDVLNQLLRKVDSILEVCCFSPQDIELYTSKYFTDASRQETALRSITSQKYLFSLCSNPLLCRFMCLLLEQQDIKYDTLPSTLTDLCQRVLSQRVDFNVKEGKPKQDITELCNRALDGFKNNNSILGQDQQISEELVDYGLGCGVLASHKAGEASGKTQVTYFANLFMQNFLAAVRLVQSKDQCDKSLLAQTTHQKKRKPQGEWQDVLQRFALGLLYQNGAPPGCGVVQGREDDQAKKKAVEAHLENLKPGELTPTRLLELFHCVFEASNDKLARILVKNLPENLSFCGIQLSLTDVFVVCHLLHHAKRLKKTFSVDLQDVCVPLSGLRELVALDCIKSYRAPTTDTIDLWEDLHRSNDELSLKNAINKFTIEPFKASQVCHIENLVLLIQIHREKKLPLCEREAALEEGVPAVRRLHKLEYELGQQNGPKAFPKLAEVLPALQSLQHLDLENNKIGDYGAEKLAMVLQSLSSLKMLNLSQNCIGDAGVEKLAKALSTMSSLQSLSIYGNLIADSGAENLALVLPVMTSLLDLDVKYNKFTDIGAKKLSTALKSSPHMKSLQMWNECIPYGVFEHLQLQDSRIKSL